MVIAGHQGNVVAKGEFDEEPVADRQLVRQGPKECTPHKHTVGMDSMLWARSAAETREPVLLGQDSGDHRLTDGRDDRLPYELNAGFSVAIPVACWDGPDPLPAPAGAHSRSLDGERNEIMRFIWGPK
jgi:hypothetical protein